MTNQESHTLLQTVTGSVLAMVAIQTNEMVSAFIVGFVGAVGAFIATIIMNWIKKKFNKKNES